jgi:hypothetical protein
MRKQQPVNTPLKQWPDAWLKMECAHLLEDASFLAMNDEEKQLAGYPVSREEMIRFINMRRIAE